MHRFEGLCRVLGRWRHQRAFQCRLELPTRCLSCGHQEVSLEGDLRYCEIKNYGTANVIKGSGSRAAGSKAVEERAPTNRRFQPFEHVHGPVFRLVNTEPPPFRFRPQVYATAKSLRSQHHSSEASSHGSSSLPATRARSAIPMSSYRVFRWGLLPRCWSGPRGREYNSRFLLVIDEELRYQGLPKDPCNARERNFEKIHENLNFFDAWYDVRTKTWSSPIPMLGPDKKVSFPPDSCPDI
ncbi:hypothetical protein JAAARDRAFT_587213 [Jaapia argillacea MUCL 33604]|uniref:Uncharacterized protein n=1 Tax=Jaapia argillacea MUCL 33604 TaxID=933084 RepID=A0A067P655_9AGAM|nr:hypothetical protein JAAARDRAFT_587213 [Jaapia argillacea MUCL 33604]